MSQKKTKYDLEYNNSQTKLYNFETKTFEMSQWKYLTVGSIIKVTKNEILPADVVVITSSNENGFCYLSTASQDRYILIN